MTDRPGPAEVIARALNATIPSAGFPVTEVYGPTGLAELVVQALTDAGWRIVPVVICVSCQAMPTEPDDVLCEGCRDAMPGGDGSVASSHLFDNGMVITFDTAGEQIPQLQGPFTDTLAAAIEERSTPTTRFVGWPPGDPVALDRAT